MRKVFIVSVLALAISGCANQQQGAPQVRDLSEARRVVENTPQYTVKAGDTLYGIAWQHNLDYRQLAALNNISPLIKFTRDKPSPCGKARVPARPPVRHLPRRRGVWWPLGYSLRPRPLPVTSRNWTGCCPTRAPSSVTSA